MRIRRILAFLLMLALLISEVTPAFAMENSEIEALSEDVTVTTDENGNTIITPNPPQIQENSEENEVNNEDILPSETEEEDAAFDGDDVVTDEDSETDVKENGEMEEEGFQELEPEESVSENGVSVSANETVVAADEDVFYLVKKNNPNSNGTIMNHVTMDFIENEIFEYRNQYKYFDIYLTKNTVINTIWKLKKVAMPGVQVNICLFDKDDNTKKYTLNVSGQAALSGCNIDGGTIIFQADSTLQINDVMINNCQFNFPAITEKAATLFLGDKSLINDKKASATITNSTYINSGNCNLKMYGETAFEDNKERELLTSLAMGLNDYASWRQKEVVAFRSMDIIAGHEDKVDGTGHAEHARIGVPLVIHGDLQMDGKISAHSFEVAGMVTAKRGSYLSITGETKFHDITVVTNPDLGYRTNAVYVSLDEVHKDNSGNTKDSELIKGSLQLSGDLLYQEKELPAFYFDKTVYNYNDQAPYAKEKKREGFVSGNRLITLTNVDREKEVLLSDSNYEVQNRDKTKLCILNTKADKTLQNTYHIEVGVYDKSVVDNAVATVYENEQGVREYFTSLADAKKYIEGYQAQENPSFKITLLKNTSVTGNELDYSGSQWLDKVDLEMEGYTITLNNPTLNVISLSNINGAKMIQVVDEAGNTIMVPDTNYIGSFSVSGDKTVHVVNQVLGSWMNLKNVKFNSTGNTVKIGDENYKNSGPNGGINLEDVSANFKNLHTFGNIGWNGEGTIKVSNELVIKTDYADDFRQMAHFGTTLQTVKCNLNDGDIGVRNFKATGTTRLATGRQMKITQEGVAEFKDIELSLMGDHGFCIALEKDVVLQSKYAGYSKTEWDTALSNGETDELLAEIFQDAKEIDDSMGTFKITGKITKPTGDLIRVEKNLVYNAYNTYYLNYQGKFAKGEDIATVNANVPAADFHIEQIGDKETFVRRYKDTQNVYHLQAQTTVVSVKNENNPAKVYATLEDAIAGIATDFKSAKGNYYFTFKEKETLTKNLIIPNCVTGLQLLTESAYREYDGMTGKPVEATYRGDYQCTLDLNGFSLTTTALVHMGNGLRMENGTFNITGNFPQALFVFEEKPLVDQDGTLLTTVKEGKITEDDRKPVFFNVILNAKNGSVVFNGKTTENLGTTTITAKELFIERGNWTLDKVTVTNLLVKTQEEVDKTTNQAIPGTFEKASLMAKNITINNGGRMEVYGRVGSEDQKSTHTLDTWNAANPSLTMTGAKLLVAEGGSDFTQAGECYLASLMVNSAYGQENVADYTVENNGTLYVKNVIIKAGSFMNRGTVLADTISNLKDYHSETLGKDHYGSLICNTFVQASGSKTYLGGGSRLLINESGNLYTLNLGSKSGGSGNPILGLGGTKKNGELKIAKVTIKGNVTLNKEGQQLEMAVTEDYKKVETLTGTKVIFDPLGYQKDMGQDGIASQEEGGDIAYAKLFMLKGKTTLFETDHKSYPVDSILVHPIVKVDENGKVIKKAITDEGGNEVGTETEKNTLTSVVHYINTTEKKNEIRVENEALQLFAIREDGSQAHLKSFTSWKDTMNYMAAIGNTNTEYVIFLGRTVIDVGGAIKLPSNVAGLTIAGVDGMMVKLEFSGNLDIVTKTELKNLILPQTTTINTKGKSVTLNHVEGPIQTMTGTSASVLEIIDTDLELVKASAVSGIGLVTLKNSTLTVGKDVTLPKLYLKNEGSPSTVIAAGKLTLTEITTVGTGNALHYSNGLEIKGNLSSYGNVDANGVLIEEYKDSSNVYAIPYMGDVLYTSDLPEEKITKYVLKEVGSLTANEKLVAKIVKKNALSLVPTVGAVGQGTFLAKAPKIPAYWFVYDYHANEIGEGNPKTTVCEVTNIVHKLQDSIYAGAKADRAKVVLNLQIQDAQGESAWERMDQYENLQDAFSEIDRLADNTASYQIVLKESMASKDKNGKDSDFTYPGKAAHVWIIGEAGGEKEISFKANATMKCPTTFENVAFRIASTSGTLNIGGYTVDMVMSQIPATMTVTGSGIGKGSCFTVSGNESKGLWTELDIKSISNVDQVKIDGADLYVQTTTTTGRLIMEDNTQLTGYGAISLKDVEVLGIATVVTFPTGVKLTQVLDEEKQPTGVEEITSMTSALTISGDVDVVYEHYNRVTEETEIKEGWLDIALGMNADKTNHTYEEMNVDYEFADTLIAANKAIIAKAPKASVNQVYFVGAGEGTLYKKSGNLVYKNSDPAVELSYHGGLDDEGYPIEEYVTGCETFAEAVAEINNLKTKRDYTIRFYAPQEDAIPETLTMPNKSYVNTLTLTSDSDVYYKGDISFTTPVILENIHFVRMGEVKENNKVVGYKPVEETVAYPTPVNVKAGGNEVRMAGMVTFNTPIFLDGGSKGILTIDESAEVAAVGDVILKSAAPGTILWEGKISNFAAMDINHVFDLDGWLTSDTKASCGYKYHPCELKVTSLSLGEDAYVTVGAEAEALVENSTPYTANVNVTNLLLQGSQLAINGNGEFKNVTLQGNQPYLEVKGQKCNITGTLTSNATEAKLKTTVDKKEQTVLNISGTAVLGDAKTNRIIIGVEDYYDDTTFDSNGKCTLEDAQLGPVTLADRVENEKGEVTGYVAKSLLKAKNIKENSFLVEESSVAGITEEFDYHFQAEGYFLKKNGDYVEVHHSDEIEVVLCQRGEALEQEQLLYYYKTMNEAVAAMKALKNPSAEYILLVRKNIGTSEVPYIMTVPEQAKNIILKSIDRNDRKTLYLKTAVGQKTNLKLEDISVVNHSTWNGNNYVLELQAADLTVTGATTLKNLKLVDGALLQTTNTTTITDIENGYTALSQGSSNKIACSKAAGLTIKGLVTNEIPSGTAPKLILDAGGVAKEPEKTVLVDSKKVPIGEKYNLSKAVRLVALEKATMDQFEYYNGTVVEGGATKDKVVTKQAVWSGKNIYMIQQEYQNTITVKVNPETSEKCEAVIRCLDMAEATNYMNTVANKTVSYEITIEGQIQDTKATDNDAISVIAFPAKDKAKQIRVVGRDSVGKVTNQILTFKGDLKVSGNVELQSLTLKNDVAFSMTLEKNSDERKANITTPGESKVILKEVKVVNGLKAIGGNKGATELTLEQVSTDNPSEGLWLTSGIKNVASLALNSTKLTTKGDSEVQALILQGSGIWEAKAKTTIGDVQLLSLAAGAEATQTGVAQPGAYVATYHSVNRGVSLGIPQLTITGKITGGNLPVKVYDFSTGAYRELGTDGKVAGYDNAKLVVAKAEAGDKFIASSNVKFNSAKGIYEFKNQDLISSKDKNGYVTNTTKAGKQVILSQKVGETWDGATQSYVTNFAEAIGIINAFGSKTEEYKITLREETTIYTAIDSSTGRSKLGTLPLPSANKAKSLTISGIGAEEVGVTSRTISYTGAITANCNLKFENVVLEEMLNNKPVNGITLNTNAYQVEFGTNAKTQDATNDTQLIFKTVNGTNGSLWFGNKNVQVTGECKVGTLYVDDDSTLTCDGNVTVTNLVYEKDGTASTSGQSGGNSIVDPVELSIIGKKKITITNVKNSKESFAHTKLNVDTYYTNQALEKSVSQLTISGEVEEDIAININPWIYETTDKTYRKATVEDLSNFFITSNLNPKNYQKVITAAKMVASDEITVLNATNWKGLATIRAVKQNNGVYFTIEEPSVLVRGYKKVVGNETTGDMVEVTTYRGKFLNWAQAVTQINTLNHTDWYYRIDLKKSQGGEMPLSSVAMPSKAKELRVVGGKNIGIITTGTNISVQCPTILEKASLCAVKKAGTKYYATPLTLNVGGHAVTLSQVDVKCNYGAVGSYSSEIKVTGNAKGSLLVQVGEREGYSILSQISNVGTVTLEAAKMVDVPNTVKTCVYEVANGIRGVKDLNLHAGVEIVTGKNEVVVTNLTIGEATNREDRSAAVSEQANRVQMKNSLEAKLEAKNINVTGTTTMASAILKAGTVTVGDGKITLKDVVFLDGHNMLQGKVDKNSKSLISIQGIVTNKDWNPAEAAATVSLLLSNSTTRPMQLVEGLTMLTAPKAASSLFVPEYDWIDTKGTESEKDDVYHQRMGTPISKEVMIPVYDELGNVTGTTTQRVLLYQLYKSGNDIKYGKVREVEDGLVQEQKEVRLHIGSTKIGTIPYIDYTTFEEAVKAIDSMALYQDPTAKTKVYEAYTIELLSDVEIGNDKKDGRYSALTFPSKASLLTILGNGHSIGFSGNITLKCNTAMDNIYFCPKKTVGKEAQPTTTNVAVGNFEWTVKDKVSFGYWSNGSFVEGLLNNVTGSTKGKVIVRNVKGLQANKISGVQVEVIP